MLYCTVFSIWYYLHSNFIRHRGNSNYLSLSTCCSGGIALISQTSVDSLQTTLSILPHSPAPVNIINVFDTIIHGESTLEETTNFLSPSTGNCSSVSNCCGSPGTWALLVHLPRILSIFGLLDGRNLLSKNTHLRIKVFVNDPRRKRIC